jgi:hypothetical protein
MVRFPHISSSLFARCKYNCLTGESQRLRRIVLQPDNFCMELARVQVELEMRGYSPRWLRKQLQQLCFTHPDLYNRSPNFLLAQIDIYFIIRHRVGPQPYSPLHLPLLEEHIVPAAN